MSGIPEEWEEVELKDGISSYGLISDGDWIESKDQDINGNVRLIQLADVGDGSFKNKSNRFMTKENAKRLNCTFLKKGDILIARMPDPLGRACIFPGVNQDAVTVVDICLLRTTMNSAFRKELLPFWINSPEFRNIIANNASGTTRKRITRKKLERFLLPLPSVAEQNEIVSRIELLLGQVDKIKSRIDGIPEILKRFRQSVLSAAVSGKLTEEWRVCNNCSDLDLFLDKIQKERELLKKEKKLKKSFGNKSLSLSYSQNLPPTWRTVTFTDIAKNSNNSLKAGPFGSSLKKSDCIHKGFKVYGQEQVINDDEKLFTYAVSLEKYKSLESCKVVSGDILISLVGTIGKVLILSEDAEEGIINPRLVKLTLNDAISRLFIYYYLNSHEAHSFYNSFSHGGTMEILNLGILQKLPLNLPPIEEQKEIVKRVDSYFKIADSIESKLGEAQKRIDNLTQSILAKAFSGDLTKEWRKLNRELITGENSAFSLLETIKKEHLKLKPHKRKKIK